MTIKKILKRLEKFKKENAPRYFDLKEPTIFLKLKKSQVRSKNRVVVDVKKSYPIQVHCPVCGQALPE